MKGVQKVATRKLEANIVDRMEREYIPNILFSICTILIYYLYSKICNNNILIQYIIIYYILLIYYSNILMLSMSFA